MGSDSPRWHRNRQHHEHIAIADAFRARMRSLRTEDLNRLGEVWLNAEPSEQKRRLYQIRDLAPWTDWDRRELSRLSDELADEVLERHGASPPSGWRLFRDRIKEVAKGVGEPAAAGLRMAGVTASAVWLRRRMPAERFAALTAAWRETLGELPGFAEPPD